MTHPWQTKRPISAWIPAGISEEKKIGEHKQRVVVDSTGCTMCGLCWLLCPEGIITRAGQIEINRDYCRCCGICVEECPKNVMSIEDEVIL